MTRRFFLALAASLTLAGCPTPGNAPPASPTTSPTTAPTASPSTAAAEASDAEGCEHLADGPATTVVANSPSMSVTPPAVAADHTRYDIQLPAFEGRNQGVVSFNSAEEGDYVFFLNQDVPFTVRGLGDAEAEMEGAASSSADCDVVKGRHTVHVGVGVYFLEFGPTTASSVGMVIEEGAHEAHDDE